MMHLPDRDDQCRSSTRLALLTRPLAIYLRSVRVYHHMASKIIVQEDFVAPPYSPSPTFVEPMQSQQ